MARYLTVLIGGGSALLLGHRPWARFLAARRGLSPWHAGVLRANLAYNGAACLGAGVLLAGMGWPWRRLRRAGGCRAGGA